MSYSKSTKIRLSKYDKIWSQMVRGRDGKCLVCNSINNLAAHHFVGRSEKGTRLMVDNGITLCPKHHTFDSNFSAHKTPKDFKLWFEESYPARVKAIREKMLIKISERQAIEEFKQKYNID